MPFVQRCGNPEDVVKTDGAKDETLIIFGNSCQHLFLLQHLGAERGMIDRRAVLKGVEATVLLKPADVVEQRYRSGEAAVFWRKNQGIGEELQDGADLGGVLLLEADVPIILLVVSVKGATVIGEPAVELRKVGSIHRQIN
ncbi:hypothetical protein GHYDROH2_32300 [Geobacter hydrogenophilus]|uniref:Uncharacterized protein n=1 Tax=Geobacter hydrogenophilus TaxID=40983 RepID=A0A9W6G3J6_9BACT|nr:hypothetical protein GHYDROH2_32300 [Geobacter hydrogenophilus]